MLYCRSILPVVLVLLVSSPAWPSSYQQINGFVVDPILDTNGFVLPYSGPDLKQGVVAPGVFLSSASSWPDLTYADLRNADLEGATISNGDLSYVSFRAAKLANANFDYAYMWGVDMTGADVNTATLWQVNLFQALLTDAVFDDSRLKFANLTEAALGGAGFRGADLESANFLDATVEDADFSRAKLTRAYYLWTTTGSALYDAETDFSGTGFDPVEAGWRLVPEPGSELLALVALICLSRRAACRRSRARTRMLAR